MFFKQLYHHNKYLAAAAALFLVASVFFFVKAGFYMSPATTYGMYSKKASLTDTVYVFDITLNGKTIDPTQQSILFNDQTQIFVDRFLKHEKRNAFVYGVVSRVFKSTKQNFFNKTSAIEFEQWMARHIEKIADERVNTLSIHKTPVVWSGNRCLRNEISKTLVLDYDAK